MAGIRKVAVIGLDCAEPSLVFGRWAEQLPNLRSLMERGTYGTLQSCMPPITVPAWSCMAASKDPGTLGIYGFRNRSDHSYERMTISTSLDVREPRIWDIIGEQGMESIVIGVPGTFPVTGNHRGAMVACFLTPDPNDPKSPWTHPAGLRNEIRELVGEYMVDVKGFRTDDKKWLLEQIYTMTDRRFRLARHLLNSKPWNLFWMVEMGTDRIHHGFWSFMDKQHRGYSPGNEFESAIFDYYRYVDSQIGRLIECLDPCETAIWVVSDHGAKGMAGGVLLNQWLVNEGYLCFKQPITRRQKFEVANVDWSRTQAWGEGGYYGRLFVNLAGREPSGTVQPAGYERLRDELASRIEAMRDHHGEPMGNGCYKPEAIYDQVQGVAPDLIVIFGDLRWRSVGWVGSDSIYTFENDTGPDDANHAQDGLYVYAHPSLPVGGRVDGPTLYDVAPTILSQLNLAVPSDMRGRALMGRVAARS